jgi:hypothetical protein
VGGAVPEDPPTDLQGQALAGIAEGGGGFGAELQGKGLFTPRAKPVGAAGQGILLDGAEGVVGAKPLKDQIPEGDQRGKGSHIEGVVSAFDPRGQRGGGQELAKPPQQLGGREACVQEGGVGVRFLRVEAFFLAW